MRAPTRAGRGRGRRAADGIACSLAARNTVECICTMHEEMVVAGVVTLGNVSNGEVRRRLCGGRWAELAGWLAGAAWVKSSPAQRLHGAAHARHTLDPLRHAHRPRTPSDFGPNHHRICACCETRPPREPLRRLALGPCCAEPARRCLVAQLKHPATSLNSQPPPTAVDHRLRARLAGRTRTRG